MKYLISESRIKKLIKDRFDIDFTGKIEEVTSAYSLLNDFDNCVLTLIVIKSFTCCIA